MAPRSGWQNDLMLVAATAMATTAICRHLAKSGAPAKISENRRPFPAEVHLHDPLPCSVLSIPLTGWKEILLRTFRHISDDRLVAISAGVVFYGLLAIFPALTALVSSYGLFADPSTIGQNLQSLAVMLPAGSFTIVQDQIARVLAKGSSTLSLTFLSGLLFALWSANAGTKAIIDALNVVYDEKEKRRFFRLNLVSLAFTGAALVALLIMAGAVVIVPLVLQHVRGMPGALIVNVGRWPLLIVLILTALAILYRYGPNRTEPHWEWLSVGAIAATTLWLGGSLLLSWYLSNFGNYDATYGSLGAAIGLMTWMWMSAIIVLGGAELNSEIERQIGRR